MTELKAYACLEPYENTGAIIFAKSNIEARRISADEFHDGDIAGMSVKRAPWADKFGSRYKVPIKDMVEHGWRFECCWSGITIDEYIYDYGVEIYDAETEEGAWDETVKGKEPVGFQEGLCFACQEYADEYYEEQRKRKEFEEEKLKYYRNIVLKNFPDAILVNSENRYGWKEHIYTEKVNGTENRIVQQVRIPFSFPGMKHSASLEVYRNYVNYENQGPIMPAFYCANGDKEAFEAWAKEQKEKYKND